MNEWYIGRDGQQHRRGDDYDQGRGDALEPVVRPPSPRRGPFVGRLISPSAFLLALSMMPLPWLDVQCQGIVLMTQSGLQACYGGYSKADVEKQIERQFGAMGKGKRDGDLPPVGMGQKGAMEDPNLDGAPLIIVFAGLVLAGLVFGLVLSPGPTRLILVLLCAAGGSALLVTQLMIGFPVAKEMDKANDKLAQDMKRQLGGAGKQDPAPQQPLPAALQPRIEVRTTPWFWFAVFLALAPVGVVMLEHFVICAGPRTRPRQWDDLDGG